MESTLLFLAFCLMFSGVLGDSQSMSCSMVNGKTICNRQTSEGGSAMASSMSSTGMGPDYQSTYAGAGGPGQWDSSSQTLFGGPTGVSSFSSGPASFVGSPGGFVGGFASAGSFPFSIFSGPGYPPQGSTSFSSSSSSSGGAPAQGPGNPPPPMIPIAAGPMAFVNQFMGGFGGGFGGGAFAGAGAGAGIFPFGRR